ncbi:uncharacterized protein LOC101856608 [Aplysia californica]|uniref:Uncharacterized protein LOC101856608 n=1 Tax=Aplysia californica TaxID=6500 RepID=A0ABM0K4T6_APLCA|nr:uncharacterized protein LOC101856608 [Aplysia californica]
MAESEKRKEKQGGNRPEHWFSTSKRIVCKCEEFDLENSPQLLRILPENYDYKLCDYFPYDEEDKDKFNITLRLSLTSVEEVMLWKQLYEEKSLTSHVVEQTFPKASAARVFKRYYRCKFNSIRKKKSVNGGRSLGCPALMSIVIRGLGWSKACKVHDPHLETHPTQIRIRFAHSHPLDTPEMLNKRELCPEIRKRFEEMFKQGMKPKDALEKHKWDLHKQLGPEKYLAVTIDSFYMPKPGRLTKMYKSISGQTSIRSATKRASKHNPDANRLAFEQCASKFADSQNDDFSETKESVDAKTNVSFVRGTEVARDSKLLTANDSTWSMQSAGAENPEDTNLSCSAQKPSDSHRLSSVETDALDTSLSSAQGQGQGGVLFSGSSAPVLTLQNMETLSFDGSSSKLYRSNALASGMQTPKPQQHLAFLDVRGAASHLGSPDGMGVASSSHHSIMQLQQQHHNNVLGADVSGGTTSHPVVPPQPPLASSTLDYTVHHQHHQLHSSLAHTHTHTMAHPNFSSSDFSSSSFAGYHQPVSHGFYSQNMIGHDSTAPHNTTLSHFSPSSFAQPRPSAVEAFHPHSFENKRLPPHLSFPGPDLSLPQQTHGSQYLNKPKHLSSYSSMGTSSGSNKGRLAVKRKAAEDLSNSSSSSSSSKKIVPKRSPINLYNAKRFRASLLKKKSPMINTNTHQQVSEALQTILLADKAKKVKERLSKFCSVMEQKLATDVKTYVPVVTKFLDVWDCLISDADLVHAMKEFGKAPQTIIDQYEIRRRENLRDRKVQTLSSYGERASRKSDLANGTASYNKKVQTLAIPSRTCCTQTAAASRGPSQGVSMKTKGELNEATSSVTWLKLKPFPPAFYVQSAECTSKGKAKMSCVSAGSVPSSPAVKKSRKDKVKRSCLRSKGSSIYDHVSSTVLLRVQNSIKNKDRESCDSEADFPRKSSKTKRPKTKGARVASPTNDLCVSFNDSTSSTGHAFSHNNDASSHGLTDGSFSVPSTSLKNVSEDCNDRLGCLLQQPSEDCLEAGSTSVSDVRLSEASQTSSSQVSRDDLATVYLTSLQKYASQTQPDDLCPNTDPGHGCGENSGPFLTPKLEPLSPVEVGVCSDEEQNSSAMELCARQVDFDSIDDSQPSTTGTFDTKSLGEDATVSIEKTKRLVVKLTRI